MKQSSVLILVLLLCMSAVTQAQTVITETISPSGLRHPGCLQSAAEINALATAQAQNIPERTTTWNSMLGNPLGRIDTTGWIPSNTLYGITWQNIAAYAGSSLIRYVNDWVVNGNTSSEAAAIQILNKWAEITNFNPDPNDSYKHHRLQGGAFFGNIAAAADLLMSSQTSWPASEQAAFKDTLRNVLLPIVNDDRPFAFYGNWDIACTWSVMAIAVCLDDKVLFDEQIEWLKNGRTNARISYYVHKSGQCQESIRDQMHAHMGMHFLALCCQIAWTQGIDLYETPNCSIGRAFEYQAAYNLGEDRLPFQLNPVSVGSNSGVDTNTVISARGSLERCYEMVYHHYKNYRKTELPYCKQALENHTRNEIPSGSFQTYGTALYKDLDLSADTVNRPAAKADVSLAITAEYQGRSTMRGNCGGWPIDDYVSKDGRIFTKEKAQWVNGGSNQSHTNLISGTEDQDLYQRHRYNPNHYSVAMPSGTYWVTLHFAEPTVTTVGARVFDILIEGNLRVDDLDIYAEAGIHTAYTREMMVDITDGQFNIEFIPGTSYPVISAFEIEPYMPDRDSDGLTDFQEQALGTDENDSNSIFSITDEGVAPSNKYKIEWPSAANVNYRILQSSNLEDWTVARNWTNALALPTDQLFVDFQSNQFFKVEADIL